MIIKDKYGTQLGYIVSQKTKGKIVIEIDIRDSDIKRNAVIVLRELERIQVKNPNFDKLKEVLKAVTELPENIIISKRSVQK